MLFKPGEQGLEIEPAERSPWLYVKRMMRDEQVALHRKHIGLHRAEAPGERIDERPLMLIVVVGMGRWKRARGFQ